MKKIIFLGSLIFIISIGIGFCFGRVMLENKVQESLEIESDNIVNNNQIIEEAVSTELKVKPNI